MESPATPPPPAAPPASTAAIVGGAPAAVAGPSTLAAKCDAPLAGCYDECYAPDGALRPDYEPLFRNFDHLGPEDLRRRWEQADRLIAENGVTFDVYSQERGSGRPWRLDPLPLIMSDTEWAPVEAGLGQRARLLNLILRDLYGPQKLLGEGALPPALVLANTGFLRACHGVQVPSDLWAHACGCDLVRASDGRWLVVGDRTQSPVGIAYAIENRGVLSRVLPQALHDCHARRIAPFLDSYRALLAELSPRGRDEPRLVLLTPGPKSQGYFEHAFLARSLGYTLVESEDLTVRGDTVYLKTLAGLQRVDVILRRLQGDIADPLEMFQAAAGGVPGLMQAVRGGQVALANALGSSLVEAPAFLHFLPDLCRRLLGEDLLLPSPATHWCGEPSGLEFVVANIEKLVVKPALRRRRRESIFGHQLTRAERQELVERLRSRPFDFVGQELAEMSSMPVWIQGRLERRRLALRTHALLQADGTATVMPGGLALTAIHRDSAIVALEHRGGCKDVWVVAPPSMPQPIELAVPPAPRALRLQRAARDFPSRVADSFFWLGRYTERVENSARVLRFIIHRIVQEDAGSPQAGAGLARMADAILRGDPTVNLQARPGAATVPPLSFEAIARAGIYDARHSSLRSILQAVHQNAWRVKDRLAADAWRAVAHLEQSWERAPDDDLLWDELLTRLDELLSQLLAFSGLCMESMTRAHGWRFLDIGRRIERAQHLLQLLGGALIRPSADEAFMLHAILQIADSSMTYRSRYLNSLQAVPVIDLLLADETNPRSVVFQLRSVLKSIDALPRERAAPGLSAEQSLALGALDRVLLADVHQVGEAWDNGMRPDFAELLQDLDRDLGSLSHVIGQTWFAHAQEHRQGGAPWAR